MTHQINHAVGIAVFAICALLPAPAHAQLPQIRLGSAFPSGAKTGSSVTVTVAGSTDADEATELLFSHSGIQAVAHKDDAGTVVPNQFDVSIADSVPVGIYDVRLKGLFGISNPRPFRIDTLPELTETEPNNAMDSAQALSLGQVVNARSNAAGDVDCFSVDVTAGQTIVLRTESAQIDSTMQPVINLFASNGRRLASARRILGNDAAVVVTSDTDQRLTVRIHDLVYAGSDTTGYRLIVDDRPLVDFVWPPVIPQGAAAFVEIFGRHIPGGEPSGLQLHGSPLLKKAVSIPADLSASVTATGMQAAAATVDTVLWNAKDANLLRLAVCEPGIPIYRDSDPVVTSGRSLSGSFTVAGRFGGKATDDTIRFFAAKDSVRDIEVISQRLGFSTKAMLTIEQVATSDDGSESFTQIAVEENGRQDPGSTQLPTFTYDPAYRLTAPADGIYQVRIRDLFATIVPGPDRLYVLNVHEPRPDFELIAFESIASLDGLAPPIEGAISVRKGGRYQIPIYVLRKSGHNAPITIAIEGLPAGVTCDPSVIESGKSAATLTLNAGEEAPETAAPIRIIGTSAGDSARTAQIGTLVHAGANGLPRSGRLAATAMLCVMKDVQPFQVNIEQPADLKPGDKQQLKLSLIRRNGFNGKVDVTFVGLPANVEVPAVSFAPDIAEATVEVNAKAEAAIGSAQLLAYAAAAVPYRRNPWKAERAHAVVSEIQKQIEQQQSGQSEKQASKDKAVLEIQQLTESINRLVEQEQTQAKALSATIRQLADATTDLVPDDAVQPATAGADSATADLDALDKSAAAVILAIEEARPEEAAVLEFGEQIKSARTNLSTSRNEHRVFTEQLTTLQTTIAETEKALADLTATLEQLTAKKTEADKEAAAADEATKPADVNVRFPCNPIMLQIKAAE